jgi:hypothetical protein
MNANKANYMRILVDSSNMQTVGRFRCKCPPGFVTSERASVDLQIRY